MGFFDIQSLIQILQNKRPHDSHSKGSIATSEQMMQSNYSKVRLTNLSFQYPEWVIFVVNQVNKKILYINQLELSILFSIVIMEGDHKRNKKILKLNDFSVEVILGSGSFGKVKLARRKKDGAIMCVKTMVKSQIIESKQTDHIINQCQIVSQVSHPFIVGFNGIAQDSKFLHLFMEYIPGGELFSHLRQEGVFDAAKTSFYISQVVLIFEYLHQKDIIYRDLKPENILIAKDGYIKLTDFGFAKKIENRTFTLCGTPEYLAPQVLLNQGHGKPVDWWTLGVLLYEMLAGIDPFSDKDPMSVYHNILKGKLRFPKDFDQDGKSLIKHLLVSDLSKRFGNLKNGVNDIKSHRFLSTIAFPSILSKKAQAPFIPTVKKDDDTSNFDRFDDSVTEAKPIESNLDPFLQWL